MSCFQSLHCSAADFWFRRLCIGVVAGAVAGCAAAPPPLPRVDAGQRVDLQVRVSAPENDGVHIHNRALGAGAKGGTAAGAVVGGLWGLACGPFFWLCSPLGAAVFMAPGALLGTAVGAAASLPNDKATLLRERLNQAQQSFDLAAALRSNVAQRAQKHWTLSTEAPAWLLTLEVQNVELSSTHDEQIGMTLRVQASLRRLGAQASALELQKTFEYVAPPAGLPVWLDERGDFIDTLLRSGVQQLATQIVSELASS